MMKQSARVYSIFMLAIAVLWLFQGDPALAQTSPFGMPNTARAASPEAGGIALWFLAKQAEFHRAMTGAMQAIRMGNANPLPLLALAFGYGFVHAIGPGHGKAIIASYLVANEGTMRRGIALAFGAAFVQAFIAFGLVAVVAGLLGGTARMMEDLSQWIERLGFALILVMGLWILWRKSRFILFSHHHKSAEHCAECGHQHAGDAAHIAAASPRELALTALGAGARPCSGAIILLVFALTQGLFVIGALSVAIMAIGTAIGTSLFAVLAVKAKQIALRIASGRSGLGRIMVLVLEALAGLALALFGLALLTGAMVGGA